MLFETFFPKLIEQQVTIELKDGTYFKGTLKHVDMHYNAILDDLVFSDDQNYGQLKQIKTIFIRGTQIKFIGTDDLDQKVWDQITLTTQQMK
ncbi:LSM_domain-containing protein [Hexamita inflata]|uniref:LSM domain-containing protein n=1 Tax=Hexamita inflata TaxID=28002 RepID=A0AA86NYM9_9EUKA|nr:LSM domain-containing protein [Hexamita inflata]CAI9977440.1 LSM domain-containing protein [Hexamita inflata]